MSELRLNGQSVQAQAIRELTVPLPAAQQALDRNGLDEIYFEQDGKTFVAYGSGLQLGGMRKGEVPALTRDGKPVQFLALSNETNTAREGAKKLLPTGAAVSAALGVAVGYPALSLIAANVPRMANNQAFIQKACQSGSVVVAAIAATGASLVGAGALFGALRPGDTRTIEQLSR